jgi:UDP-N-acetyl-D-galactosamine dehydrogenase
MTFIDLDERAPHGSDSKKIAVVGLGYVGLPLAVEFGKKRPVLGFDVDVGRIGQLQAGSDSTREVDPAELRLAAHLDYTTELQDLKSCKIFIITVPTPIDRANRPDLGPLTSASETVGKALSPGAIVVYESTVYPGCTRNVCVPILERFSNLRFNEDFFVGYSPERTNPGDREHRLTSIKKVTSGSTQEVADAVDSLYGEIITAGTYKATSIEVAEAAKVIENTQRDINIALMNELAAIFHLLNIDTQEVLAAASTKWNFLPFKPGLVGGHCIGVDPYYLTYCAQGVGYHPEVILAGRRVNDGMGDHVRDRLVQLMMKRRLPVVGSRILVMGLTFKENCPDLRNSKVIDVIEGLKDYNADVDVYDPWVSAADAMREYKLDILASEPEKAKYDAILIAVGHREFLDIGSERIRAFGKEGSVLYDVKSIFSKLASDGRL